MIKVLWECTVVFVTAVGTNKLCSGSYTMHQNTGPVDIRSASGYGVKQKDCPRTCVRFRCVPNETMQECPHYLRYVCNTGSPERIFIKFDAVEFY